jgi:hypothetical protein
MGLISIFDKILKMEFDETGSGLCSLVVIHWPISGAKTAGSALTILNY